MLELCSAFRDTFVPNCQKALYFHQSLNQRLLFYLWRILPSGIHAHSTSFLSREERVLMIKSARPWAGLAFALSLKAEIGTFHFSKSALSTGFCRLSLPVLFIFNHDIWKDPPGPSYACLPHQFSFHYIVEFPGFFCGSYGLLPGRY